MDPQAGKAWTPGANPNTHNCGLGFMVHAYSKLVTELEHFAQILHSMGVSMPGLMGWITSVVELVGGLGMLILAEPATFA